VELQSDHKMVKTGFILSVVSGALITLQGALHIIRTQWGLELLLGEFRRHSLRRIDFTVLGIVTIVLGIMVLVGAYLMRRPGREREGGITVIAFSVLTVFAGGGYLVGVILGVVGGALALTHYQTKEQSKAEQTAQ
jgi:hypothetical protein